MKKLFSTILIVGMLLALPANAATKVEVEALTEFSSLNPVNKMKVIAHEKVEFENGVVFENGTIINGSIVEVKQPTRGKRNATFKFMPTSYTYNGKTTKVFDDTFIGKYIEKKEFDKGNAALSAASTAGGMILGVPGFSQGVSMVKGMVKNTEENRLKSGMKQVYKDSPLSYVEEGKDVIIKNGDIFYLKFKTNEAEDLDSENETLSVSNLVVNTPTQQENQNTATKPSNLKFPHPDEVLREVESNSK